MSSFSVVDVLKVGLAGLVFLLAFMAYKLISQMQKESRDKAESAQARKLLKGYLWLSIAFVLIVGVFSMSELMIKERNPTEMLRTCQESLDRLDTYAKSPNLTVTELRSAVLSNTRVCADEIENFSAR